MTMSIATALAIVIARWTRTMTMTIIMTMTIWQLQRHYIDCNNDKGNNIDSDIAIS